MHPTSKLIEQLLQDDSFPSMVILDGVWGEGKTHFVKNTLLKELKKDDYKTFYLSLTGIADVSEYRDRLLSVSFETLENSSRFLKRHSNTIGQAISSVTGQDNSGLIGGILAGGAGFFREKLLHKLDNIRFIVDDLDRVKNRRLCDLIVGESLQLADSDSKNIQFIFVVNGSKSYLSSDLREKAFSGTAMLDMTFDDLIGIAFSGKDLNTTFLQTITETIKQKDIKNLRVLKRLANKAKVINHIVIENNEVDQEIAFSYLGHNLTLICHYLYQEGYSSERIWNVHKSSQPLPDPENDEKKEPCPDEELKNIDYGISEKLVQYCAFETSEKLTIDDLGRLPSKSSEIEKIIQNSSPERLNEQEFKSLVHELKTFVFNTEKVQLQNWFDAFSYYLMLIKLGFIDADVSNFIKDLDDLCLRKFFKIAEHERFYDRLHYQDLNPDLYGFYKKYKKRSLEKFKISTATKYLEEMTISWCNVGQSFYDNYKVTPFFNTVSNDVWQKCIEKWSPLDFSVFTSDMYVRYEINNIKDFLNTELESLTSFHKMILDEIATTPIGQKKGAMEKARRALAKAIEKLTP
jgi:hypothetical protein